MLAEIDSVKCTEERQSGCKLSAVALGYASLEDSLPRNSPLRDTNVFHQASSRDQSCLRFASDFSWEFTNLPHKTRLQPYKSGSRSLFL